MEKLRPKNVKVAYRSVSIDGELRDRSLLVASAHDGFHVWPHGVRPLGDDPIALVEHFIEDLDTLIRQPDLIGVWVHKGPSNGVAVGSAIPVFKAGVEFATDILDRLLDQ